MAMNELDQLRRLGPKFVRQEHEMDERDSARRARHITSRNDDRRSVMATTPQAKPKAKAKTSRTFDNSGSGIPQGWRVFTQRDVEEQLAAGMERPSHQVGELIPDRVVGGPGGQQYVRMGIDPSNPTSMLDYTAYKKTIEPEGFAQRYGPLISLAALGGVAAGGLAGAGAAGAGAGEAGAGAAFDPGMFSAGDWAGGGAGGFGDAGGSLVSQGLDPLTMGESVNPWSTNPSVGDLGGNVGGTGAGGTGGLPNMPPGVSTALQQLLGGGGGPGGGPGGTGAGGNNMADTLGMIMALNSLFGDKNEMDPAKMNALWGAGMDTYNAGRDPQNALRDRTQQRVVDQTRAGQSARGIAMSPYAAAGEGEAAKNFNIDWQSQQLNRQKTGFDALALASGGYFNQANQDRNFGAGQNAAATNALLTGGSNLMQPGGWLNSLFSGNQGGTGGGGQADPGAWAGDMSGFGGGNPAQDAFGGGSGGSPAGGGYNFFDPSTYGGGGGSGGWGGDWQMPYQQAYNAYNGGP